MKVLLLIALVGFAAAEFQLKSLGPEELNDIILARFNNEEFDLGAEVDEDGFKNAVVGALFGEEEAESRRGPEGFSETYTVKQEADAKIKTRTRTIDEPSLSQIQGGLRVEFNRRRHGAELNETLESRRGRRSESIRIRGGYGVNTHNTRSNQDVKQREGFDLNIYIIQSSRRRGGPGEEEEFTVENLEHELDEEFSEEFGSEEPEDDDEEDFDLEGRRDRHRRRGGKRITFFTSARVYRGTQSARGVVRKGSRSLSRATVLVHPRGSSRLATVFTQVRGRQLTAAGAGRRSRRVATETHGSFVTAVRRGGRRGYGDAAEEEELLSETF